MSNIILELEFSAEFPDADWKMDGVPTEDQQDVLTNLKNYGIEVTSKVSYDNVFSGEGTVNIAANPSHLSKITTLAKQADRIDKGTYFIDFTAAGGPMLTIWFHPLVDKLLK